MIVKIAPRKLNPLLASVAILFNTVLFSCGKDELTCVDLIKEFSNESQVLVLRAKYQVSGKKSAKVENFLIENYQMSSLKFVCCGWEPVTDSEGRRYGTYSDRRGYNYEIKMSREKF